MRLAFPAARFTARAAWDAEETSQWTNVAAPPARRMSATALSPAPLSRSAINTSAPSSANFSAIARPIPCAAPVTTAILFSSLIGFLGAARYGVAGQAQVLRQINLHLRCRFIRHRVQVLEKFREQAAAVARHHGGSFSAGLVVREPFGRRQARHPHIHARLLAVT